MELALERRIFRSASRPQGLVAKDFLDTRLGIVEVAAHGVNSDIPALLRCHLRRWISLVPLVG